MSDFPLWREIVDRCQCGICVDPKDPVRIAHAVRDLLDDPAGAMEMGKMESLPLKSILIGKSKAKN